MPLENRRRASGNGEYCREFFGRMTAFSGAAIKSLKDVREIYLRDPNADVTHNDAASVCRRFDDHFFDGSPRSVATGVV